MDTCVLIPQDLSLVLQARPRHPVPGCRAPSPGGRLRPLALPEMGVAVWANRRIAPGTILRPDDGEMRLDKLEIYTLLRPKDVRLEFGCHDDILEVEGHDVRHCNWVRFVHSSSDHDLVNVVASKLDGQPVFQVVKPILPNEEIVVFFNRVEEPGGADVEVAEALEASEPPLKRLSDEFSMTTPSEDEELDVEDEEEEEEISPEADGSIEMTSASDVSYQSSAETSPIVPTGLTSREEHTTPSNRSTSGSSVDQATPVNERLSTVWTGFSPPTGAPTPCTAHRFTRDMELKVLQGPLRRKEKTWLPCEVCGKKFDRPSLLKRHMRTHTGEKPHACDVCGKAFSTSSSLNTHRRIHSGEKPHQCQICGKRFTASSNLYYHRMTHKKEKPHKCSLCSKSFPTPGDLKSHMYVHNGSWPYKCDVCNRGFSKQTNLKNHMLLHTGDKPHECPLCRKKFALQCNLRTHLKTHEGEPSGENRCAGCGRAVPQGHDLQPHGLCPGCLVAKHHPDPRTSKVKLQNPFSIDAIVSPERPGLPPGSIRFPNRPIPFPMSGSAPDVNKPPFYARAMMSAGMLPIPFGSVGGSPQFTVPWPQRPSIPHHFSI